ncbi:MAG: triphosphoribosyl-dephospho-CoA synthase [Rubripirellula sp.]
MHDPLQSIRSLVSGPGDAIRWACLLEAMSPKAGNVYPGRRFKNLAYVDFVVAADIVAKRIGHQSFAVSERMQQAVEETVALTKTNVNLGIVLLLGPLVAADEAMMKVESIRDSTDLEVEFKRTATTWKEAASVVLKGFTLNDGKNLFSAINRASAGGMGTVDEMDVNLPSGPVDIVKAMKSAADRDRVARQYATGYADLIDNVIPLLWDSLNERGDILAGISHAHIRLLAAEPDSLIARKNGALISESVQKRAKKVDLNDPDSIAKFDISLRSSTHKLNPGTTADLIAAGLYVLLRTVP